MKLQNLLLLSTIVLIFSCNEKKTILKENIQKSTFDSLSNQPITEKVFTPELLWKFGRIGDFDLSPDGKLIVFTVTRYSIAANKGFTDLFVVKTDGGEIKHLTKFEGNEYNPRWHPNGNKIGFICTESGEAQIWEINTDGTNAKQISKIKDGINSFEYSPDGKRILYTKDVQIKSTLKDIYPDLPKANVYMAEELIT